MSRCDACYSVITKRDIVCYVCGQKVPRYASLISTRKQLSLFSNILFLCSLGFTGFALLSGQRLPLPVTVAVSCAFLGLKLLADRYAGHTEERLKR